MEAQKPTESESASKINTAPIPDRMEVAMALARCEICGCPKSTKLTYPYPHKRLSGVGGPIYCGTSGCIRQADVLWLSEKEEQGYLAGMRVFRLHHAKEAQVA